MKSLSIVLNLLIWSSIITGQELTIGSLLSAPFHSQLTASGDGSTIAWIEYRAGERNVYTAAAPDFRPVKRTKFAGDHGLDIQELSLSHSGGYVLFVRGNAPNRKGQPANPAQLQKSTERIIHLLDLKNDSLTVVGPGTAPAFSPDGRQIIFLRGGEVMQCMTNDPGEIKTVFKLRDGVQKMLWSPDAGHIAFVTQRGDHAFTGYFDINTGTVHYTDPSLDQDIEPAWSPDGRKLAFIRIPATQQKLIFVPRRSGQPWSVRIYDLDTQTGREVWKAPAGPGSILFQEIPLASGKLIWSSNDEIIFPWEGNGWQQLYAIEWRTGKTKHLTPGQGEVESMYMSADRSLLLYTANIGDIHRRHVWQYDCKSGKTRQISTQHIEWNPVPIQNGIAFLYSTTRHPARVAILIGDAKIRDVMPESNVERKLAEAHKVTPEIIHYTAADGMPIPAQLFLPPERSSGKKYPAVIFIHGGSRRQMLPGYHYGLYYSNAYALNQYFANQGYIVLSINFRSGIGYGLDFREALNYGASGASEFNDVLGAGLYLIGRADVDEGKIALWGASYGGYLTAMGLSRASDLFACGVDIHGVHDWNEGIRNFIPTYVPEHHTKVRDLAFRSSPEYSIDSWKSPVLLIHGDDDRNVNFAESVRIIEKLRERNVYTEQLVLPDEVHSFLLHKSWVKVYEATYDFIHRMLHRKK